MQNNENYLLELIRNQTTIVELENNVLKKSEANIQKQFLLIDGFMNETNTNFAKVESEMEAVMASNYFNSASLSLHLLTENLKGVQEMLFETLTEVYKGHMKVRLLSPVNLINQLDAIAMKLPRTLSLPVKNTREGIKDLYKLLYVKARVTETYFLFEIHIPLISDEIYTFYQAIPLPIKTNTETYFIQLSSTYIAVNFRKNTYITLMEDDLKHCVQEGPDNFLCYKNLPVFNLNNNNIPCEAKLLSHYSTLPCDVTRAPCKDAWFELHAPNTWLAKCCTTCNFRIICDSDVTMETLTTSGIITLAQGCMLQSNDLIIFSHNQYSSNAKMDYNFNIYLY